MATAGQPRIDDEMWRAGHRCGALDMLSELWNIADKDYGGDDAYEKRLFVMGLARQLRERLPRLHES